ncbi:TadE/TadG family type IV pilus assembly protein [Aestuariivirga sp.]|uniref:TadE/TadG family type IV pilus assembly protein n=1 Tax=Aestuariivirga sp. TaxID=2650926 RepID=UPI003BABC34A
MEFILFAPLLIILFMGMADVVNYVSTLRKLNTSAELMADLVTHRGPFINASEIDDFFVGAELALTPIPISNVRITVFGYFRNPVTKNAELRWSRSSTSARVNGNAMTNGATAPTCADPDTVRLTPLTENSDIVVVVVCANYVPPRVTILDMVNILGFSSKLIRREIVMRPLQSATLTCRPPTGQPNC